MIGLTVVGKPVAQVMTSSPGLSALSRRMCEVSAVMASRLADEPELVVSVRRVPVIVANSVSNCLLKRPVVSHMSRQESTSLLISGAPTTLPLGGTTLTSGTNALGPWASSA